MSVQIFIEVTNKNDFTITDSYDGQEYIMEPNEVCTLPFHVAAHFFGLLTPEDVGNRAHVDAYMGRRWGWNRPDLGKAEAKKRASNIKIETAVFEMRKVARDHNDLAPPRVDERPDATESKSKKREAA